MFSFLIRYRLLGSLIATIVAFAILIGLGAWQLQRLAWKEGLLAQISERTSAAPQSFSNVLAQPGKDPEYRHVSVAGRFHHDKEQYLWAPDAKYGPGYHAYTPLEYQAGSVVWVNRGFVPEAQKAAASRSEGQPAGEVTVTGLIRVPPAEQAMFAPDNAPERNFYYWASLDEMHRAAFEGGAMAKAPYFVDADAMPANAGGWPKGGATRVSLSNRHLEYAMTWFGLAGALLAVYAAFAASRVRRQGEAPPA